MRLCVQVCCVCAMAPPLVRSVKETRPTAFGVLTDGDQDTMEPVGKKEWQLLALRDGGQTVTLPWLF